MPQVSDYVTIVGSNEKIHLGDQGLEVWEDTFGTGGRDPGGDAHIFVEFYGLEEGEAEVLINNTQSGILFPYTGDLSGTERRTQILSFPAERLADGRNEVQINAVERTEGSDTYDDFYIENMVCHFHQEA